VSPIRLAAVAIVVLGPVALAVRILLTESSDRAFTIDERSGTVEGVGVGDSESDVRRAFGRPEISHGGPYTPLDESHVEVGGPLAIPIPGLGRRGPPPAWRYDDVVFLMVDGKVLSFMVTADGSDTSRGVGVGDDLDDVRAAFPGIRCGESPPFGESILPFDEPETYPYCRGSLGGQRSIWFGEDPVRNVTITDYSGF
jgi:hypothetical protein